MLLLLLVVVIVVVVVPLLLLLLLHLYNVQVISNKLLTHLGVII